MGAADAYQHTDSNRNDNGSDVVHGTLKAEIGFGESSSNPIYYNGEINKKREARVDFLCYLIIFNRRACSVRDMHRQ